MVTTYFVCLWSSVFFNTSPSQDTFIGFGGNVVREKVRDGAPWFVYSFQELIDELRPLEEDQTCDGTHTEQLEGYTNGWDKCTNGFTEKGFTNKSSVPVQLKLSIANGSDSAIRENDAQTLD